MVQEVTQQEFFIRRYGANDTLGALNEITPEHVRAACQLVKEGRSYPLGRVLEEGIPAYGTRSFKQVLVTDGILEGHRLGKNEVSSLEEFIACTYQMGTHLDGLAHIGLAECCYGGRNYLDIVQPNGVRELGIENVGPVITRGILLDIAGLKGVPNLEGGYMISPRDLDEACARERVEVAAGDALLIHTGWGKYWMVDNDAYGAAQPGIGPAAAEWATDRRVALIGSDNWGIEAFPFADPDIQFPVHHHCLTRYGCYLLENLNLSELAADHVYEFCYVMTPHTARGATAAHVAPAAVI